jgi:hypothetical protein
MSLSRRTFLVASGAGLAGLPVGRVAPTAAAEAGSSAKGSAKSTILFFLCGGASHIDMWDLKPDAPAEYRGPFTPIATTASGVRISEHLPMLAKQAHHLAIVNSVKGTVNTNDHHAGYYHNLTGHVPDPTFLIKGNNRTPYPDDWPYMGTVVAAKRPRHPHLPNAITLPHKPSRVPYTRPGQFAARLGVEYDPLYVQGNVDKPLEFRVPALQLQAGIDVPRLINRRNLLQTFDAARADFDQVAAARTWSRQQERAMNLLVSSAATDAFDVSQESPELRQRYGDSVNAMSLLAARRLVEAEVPFITVFWMENKKLASKCKSAGGWDTHGNNFGCLKNYLLPEFDRAYSALIEDLSQRGLLDETLLLLTSEMGRKPKIGDPRSGGKTGAGRDHWTHCLSDVLAGGGIRGGQMYGSSDRYAEFPADKPVTPGDIAKTVYSAMGIENLEAFDKQNRPYNLLVEGESISGLL